MREFKPIYAESNDHLIEAWERMTTGGLQVEISPANLRLNPWGIARFRNPTPLMTVGYEDRPAHIRHSHKGVIVG